MWYDKAKRYAQALNIPGPIPGLPGYAPPSGSSAATKTPSSPRFDPYTGAPLLGAGDEAGQSDPQATPNEALPQLQFPSPPIHERCHCHIETIPGGRQVWKANENACNQCLSARDAFNQAQDSQPLKDTSLPISL